MMIVSASPMMKPLSTGSEMNEAMNPIRSTPGQRAEQPHDDAPAPLSWKRTSASPGCATSATTLADRAAVPDIVATTRCREEPSSG